MNVAGLTNQAFAAPAPKAQGGKASASSQPKEKSSFESILGGAQSRPEKPEKEVRQQSDSPTRGKSQFQSKPETQTQSRTPAKSRAPEARNNDNDNDRDDVDQESIPTSPNFNGISSPALGDRFANSPVNPSIAAAMAQPQPAANVQEDTANSLTRRVVWNDFMRKMSDLGVSAEDVLQAFGSLSDKDLALPPEQTVDKVVFALGLDGQQATLAKQYFNELLAKTKSKSFGEELAASNKQVSLTLMTQRELQRKNLQKSLDAMDRNFFMPKPMMRNPQGELVTQAAQLPQAQPTAGSDNQAVQPQSENSDESLLRMAGLLREPMSTPAGTPVSSPQAPIQAPQAMNNAAQMNNLVGQMQTPAADDKKSIDQLIRNFNMTGAKGVAQAAAPAAMPSAVATAAADAAPTQTLSPEAASALNAIFAGGGSDNGGDSFDDSTGDEGAPQDLSQLNTAMMGEHRLGDSQGLKGDFQAQMAKGASQPQAMAAPDLVQQAQVMVRDGGGEMKVTLTPDGLGDVAMHVKVNDGKVSVQMVTESDEAKKLIERQITELKHGLSQNNLNVDSIKVDTATNLGKQMEQQYQDAQRQQMQAAMEQFRQDTGGWRRSFFETGAVNPYRSQGDAPRDSKGPQSSTASSKAKNGNRRLDLVA